uniref:AMP-dependent synthetase/ligase domain-containing protein n=1 Tax=Euplotes crassus TaxID=5936 RepID=A0A7S3K710_EUPCR|mmetsp:Transcript_13025/g.13015  ORF Transcript_13025/g.13015 Transcript_13025/m.13015 type:complete len:197 (+) Transcript_13025:9-599(+)
MATTYVGGSIGYSSGNINDLSLDMQALKPTHFYCSSKLLLKFYKKIQASISKKNRIMLRAVKWALSSKSESLKTSSSVDNRMYDRTVLKPLKRSVLGTGMKHIIVGGDYISQEILDFIRISCSTKIWEAYTHKQAAGIISLASADDIVKDHVGGVLEHLEMKLEYVERKDCPEFTCDEDPPTIGRIFIKGPGVVKN